MLRTIQILRFNFLSRLRERFLVNLISLLTVALLIFVLISTGMRLPWLLLFYVIAYICLMNLDAVDKNVGLTVLTDFPLTLRDVLEILSFKFIWASLLAGVVVLAGVRLVMPFSIFEWANILVADVYFSLIFFLVVQITIRGTVAADPLSILMLGGGLGVVTFLWAILYHLYAPVEAAASIVLVALYHVFILRRVASSAADRVCQIMEKISWTQ